jgi:hypothetical protein
VYGRENLTRNNAEGNKQKEKEKKRDEGNKGAKKEKRRQKDGK